jgi:hypothetical protein
MRVFLFSFLIALLAFVPPAYSHEESETATTNMQPPRPDGPVRQHSGPRAQWTADRWLDEAYYLEGERELGGSVDALWTALRLGGGGQRHAYGLGLLLLELRRGNEAHEAFCLARLGGESSWTSLAEERLAKMGEKAPNWCNGGEDWDPYDWRRNIPATYQKWDGKLRDSPCHRAMDRAWAAKRAHKLIYTVALFGEAEKVCPNKQLIELEVAYCLLLLERPDSASASLFEVTLGPDERLVKQADRQLSIMPKPTPEEKARREEEVAKRVKANAKAEGEAGASH